jgi:hypothetical protein
MDPGGRPSPCPACGGVGVLRTTPQLQLRHHLGYRLTDRDRHDLRLLASRFVLPLPPHVSQR